MTKKEKIKEAWGVLYETHKDHINKHGYLVHADFGYIIDEILDWNDLILVKHPLNNHLYRPKSLQGIEDNNGWIKIESTEDLPKGSFDCYFITKHSDTIMRGFFNFNSKSIYGTHKEYNICEIIHYQPIEKPKPPIY